MGTTSVRELLSFEIDEQGRSGLLVSESGRLSSLFRKKTFVDSLEGLERALPDLPALAKEDPRYIDQLAYGLAVVTFGDYGLIRHDEDIDRLYLDKADDPQVLTQPRWRTNVAVQGPDPDSLCAPNWHEGKLVVTTVSKLSGMQGAFSSDRYEFSFADGWSYERSELPSVSFPAEKADARVRQAFGGDVDGFIRIAFDRAHRFSSAGDALLAALNPTGDAARFVWHGADGELRRFTTWASFQDESDAFKDTENLAYFFEHLYSEIARQRVRHDNYRIIEDPDVYREEYVRANRHIRKLRYHVDQVRVTEYEVEDFDALYPPRLQGTEAVAFFENEVGQPHRLAFDLHELGWYLELDMEPLFTERVTSDTGVLFRPLHPANQPVSPDDELP